MVWSDGDVLTPDNMNTKSGLSLSADTNFPTIGGTLLLPVGSATTPSLAFGTTSAGTATSKIYSSAESTLVLDAGSIGTVAVASALSVNALFLPFTSSINSSSLSANQLFISLTASGLSIGVYSGTTVYYVGSSSSTI